ncbi:MAG: isoprenylcysteine carboxylmethyltransferase family protein [Woeseiaceae bacterium]|nr:isoprenylcysteine carboxylmethyltransferase family protein [Woeseiaceae bacterium]
MDLRERWVNLLYRAATGTRKSRNLLTPVGALFFGLVTAAFVVLGLLVDQVLPVRWPISEGISRLISIPILGAGILITTWSVVHFLKVRGTPVPFNPPPTLVDSGPYQYVRNPMVTGVFLLLFGIGFALGSLSLVVIFTPLYMLAHLWELKNIEEPELVKRLGDDYVVYRSRTPMFIPAIRTDKRRHV